MVKKIMFPTDFSPASNIIYDCIPEFKLLGLNEAVLVHIVDKRDGRELVSRTKWANDAMEEYKEKFKKENIKVKSIVKTGIPFLELNKISIKENVSLVVITSHGQSMIKKMLLGSVAEKFLYHSKKPVLIEKVKIFESCRKFECCDIICKNTFKHILFPTDWSECANDVLKSIKKFKKFGTKTITVLHVMDDRHIMYRTAKEKKEFEAVDLKKLEKVKKELKKAGFKVNTMLSKGSPFKEIKRAARDPEVNLIAMGVHGKGFVKEMMIGSTAERVAKYAFKPVLLLSHKEK